MHHAVISKTKGVEDDNTASINSCSSVNNLIIELKSKIAGERKEVKEKK